MIRGFFALLALGHASFAFVVPYKLSIIKSMALRMSTEAAPTKLPDAFSRAEYRGFPIEKITELSSNTRAFLCRLPNPQQMTGMKTSSMVMIKGPTDPTTGAFVERAYTPTSLTDDKGTFELVVKVYPNGKVTEHLFKMKEGDEIMIKGPFPKFKYVPNMKKRLGMLAGGTGIAPMLQVIKEVLRNPDDKTEISLVFANETFEDILLKSTLDELAGKHANFKVKYVVAKPTEDKPAGFAFEKGWVTPSIVADSMPPPDKDTLVYLCGPPGFMKAMSGVETDAAGWVVKNDLPKDGILQRAGYAEDMIYNF